MEKKSNKLRNIDLDEILSKVKEKTGISFDNKNLIIEALTHPSFKHENPHFEYDNQRLEFLGDAVLNMIITEILFQRYKEASEGILTQKRIYMVKEETLYKKAKSLNLGDLILLGKGEEKQGGREKISILSDLFEAFIGALYLDKGYEFTKNFVERIFREEIESVEMEIDWKNLLQSQLMKEGKKPSYIVTREEGPEHNKIFYVELWIDNNKIAEGEGKTKREAEIKAAKIALEKMRR
ncbi:ribonuclease III [Dictyoglomus thermophilum]|uniref:Ribonuclease 3 n=1 Tax=Dictyoglomus thermophilum (strain ATCC 35947 / DSM 3960 / H-6-12) TaxID=309799 RepID=B5YDQ5_DICT6|nr:ribonuclease III [Dictyoglomus thermophilum]ACI19636.1 ribonuclease III [Dictyoglomus thermophilum H-6-12]